MPHVLFVDDDPAVRDATELLLTAHGYSVSTAADGREGLRLFEAETPDLVIADVLMPVMDGVELVLHLTRLAPTLPILAISGGWTGVDSHRYLGPLNLIAKLGVTRTLAKPFDCDALIAIVESCLSTSVVATLPAAAG